MKQKNSKSGIPALVIFLTALAFAALNQAEEGNTAAVFLIAAVVVVSAFVALVSKLSASKKTSHASAKAKAHEPRVSAKPDSGSDHKDALRCTCAHGRQRYLDQAELFLKNGIIDKAEYNVMKERYLRMDIPEEL